jgi:transcription initiation factor TFIIIB Brf1 subunit/transcription initiation factor TFIIB
MDIDDAARLYINRRDRDEHPSGEFDKKKRWYPKPDERRECCNHIRSPSSMYPYSLLVHCRSIKHIAQLCGVDEVKLRRRIRELEPAVKLERTLDG